MTTVEPIAPIADPAWQKHRNAWLQRRLDEMTARVDRANTESVALREIEDLYCETVSNPNEVRADRLNALVRAYADVTGLSVDHARRQLKDIRAQRKRADYEQTSEESKRGWHVPDTFVGSSLLPPGAQVLNALAADIHAENRAAGWYDTPREIGTRLMLIVSEISEAMEGARKGINDTHLKHRKMLEVELADAVIRIFDMAGAEGLDLGGAIFEKRRYNQTRKDHKRDVRKAPGGKAF
jgi:hypothetical protein